MEGTLEMTGLFDVFTYIGLTALTPEEQLIMFFFGCVIAVHFVDSVIEFIFTFIGSYFQ